MTASHCRHNGEQSFYAGSDKLSSAHEDFAPSRKLGGRAHVITGAREGCADRVQHQVTPSGRQRRAGRAGHLLHSIQVPLVQ